MKYILSILFIPLLVVSVMSGCGGSDGGTGDSSSSREMIMVEGTIADVVANAKKSDDSYFFTSIFNFLKPTMDAIAQTDDPDDLSGITVQAIDSEGIVVGEAISDENGNFSIEVPCDEPISLLFLLDGSTIEIGGLNFPCPSDTDTTVFITVTLDVNDEDGDIDIDEEDPPSAAVLGCDGNDDVDIDDEDVIIDGEGGPCIITTGNCQLSIDNTFVSLVGCSTCIDTRGDSSVDIDTASFECIADDTGIRSVGNSSVDIDVDADEIDDEFTDLLVEAGVVAVDARGNSDIDLDADGENDDDSQGSFESFIEILGGETSISAVGNSEVDVDADDCIIDPENIAVVGNAEVEIDCDGQDNDDDDDFDDIED